MWSYEGLKIIMGLLGALTLVIITLRSPTHCTDWLLHSSFWVWLYCVCWIVYLLNELQCWIPETKHFGWKIGSEYIFHWAAWAFSVFTTLSCLASAYVNRRLPCGHFWIGFLTRGNQLFRMGLFSELSSDDREPIFGFTFDIVWFGTKRSIVFVQYLTSPDRQLEFAPTSTVITDFESSTSCSAFHTSERLDRISTPTRDVMKMLL